MTLSLPSFTRFLVRAVPLLVLLVGASLLTQAQIIRYVKPAATGTGNGSSWANASGNLQAMINASVATDQVWVAAGTYKPGGNANTDRNVSFAMKIGVLIYGGFAGSETSLSQRPIINTTTPSNTILSGDLGTAGNVADNSYHVISNPMDLINTAVLDGFIITGGNANGGSSAGGGMYNPGNDSGLGASPTVRNCSFQGNSAGIGGAMYNYGSATSNPVLTNCSFRGNSATISGGAIYNYKNSGAVGNPMLINCSFQNNSASTSGGAIFNLGYFSNCAPELGNCSFQNNSAPQGGAFYNDEIAGYSRPQLTNCVLFGNGGSNAIRNSPNSYVEAAYSLLEAGAVFIDKGGSNVSGVTVNPFASTSSVALNACAPAINSGNGDVYNGPSTDLAGNPRFFSSGGPGTPDRIDMGAVEFQAAPQRITITPPSASSTTVGTAFNQAFSASGGSGPYILASGSLPPGITLATSGVLSGTPTQFGSYTFAVKVVDPVTGCSGVSAAYTLLVRSSKPIRYVKAGGTSNGDSWANASGDLQSQINVTGAEQVWVAAGTYKPGPAGNTDRDISFAMRPGVDIYGGFVGNETALSQRPAINPVRGNPSTTILSGDIGVLGTNVDNSYHVIRNPAGLTSADILDGFVITGGNANKVNYPEEGGGGMLNRLESSEFEGEVSPLIRNCSFQGNTASRGGAICNDAAGDNIYYQMCNPTLINCVFQDNSAGSGGAVSNSASLRSFCSPQFDNCYFINNTANSGGAMDNYSGSISQFNVRLTNCLFQGNSATSTGGAISNAADGSSSHPVLINCSFQGNSIKGDTRNVSRLGGAIYFSTSGNNTGATLTNCSFQGNTADYGGAIYVSSYEANSETNVDLISCVVFGNGGDRTFDAGNVSQNSYGLIYLRNTLIEASATKYQDRGGNITTNITPFASPNSPALAANSPAVNAGNSSVQGTDVAGNPRIVGCRIDMGAYEFQYDPTVAITAQPATNSVVCGRAPVSVPVGVSGQYLTYQWYKDSFANPVTGQTSATLTLANALPANAGSYSLVVTGGCNSLTSTAFNLTVNQPTVSISPGSATICQGKSVLLTASGASTYTWSNKTTGNTLSATTAGTYSVTGVDGNGCTNSATAVVTENKPTVSISPVSATICPGKSVLLTASGASTYTWSNNTTDNTLSATTAGTYSVTGVDGNGCANTATATITENKPTVSISPNPASICQGSSVLLTASGTSTGGALSYTWSDNTTGNTLTATTPGTYSVTGMATNGCVNSATATVTDARPIVSITATPSATVTQGAAITLTASGTGATSFAWSSGGTGNSTVINPATSAPYSVTVRNGAGCVTVASIAITVTPISCGPVIYVTQTGSGQRDGSSWANALGSSQLQFGINTAAGCGGNGQVWVAAGMYKPTTGSDRNASFALRNGVSVYGGFVGNETALTDRPVLNPVANQPASTTLSGDIGTVGNTGDNSFRVISNPASLSLTTTAVLDGFVITGGAGGTLGGGMFNDGSSPTLRNCSFVGNSVSASGSTISRGGAMYNGNSSSPQLYNCYFLTNSASSLVGVNGFGGAMANLNSSNPQLTNCNFVNNRVSGNALNQGGAIANNLNSSPQLINCSFLTNSVSGSNVNRGGAVANANGSNAQLINCSFLSNSVSGATSSTGNQGGAVYNGISTPQLTNCVLFGNGGANTIYNATDGSIVVAYSLLETTVTSFTAGAGNLTTDVSPFVSAADTRLNGCSPAINAGDNSANSTTTDLDGNPRFFNNSTGTPDRIDMGAYEYQGAPGVITTVPTVSTATVGVAFSQNFTTSGGTGPYSYTLASGSLPTGLSLSNTGVLSGTPTQTGSFTITVRGQDATGCLGVSAPYVLTVIDAASPNPTLAGFAASPGTVCVGSPAAFTATVGNVTGSYNYTLTNGSDLLTGTATTSTFSQSITASGTSPQTFTLTVRANGQSVSSTTTLTVNPLPVASLTNNGPLSCAQASVTLTASGGSSYTFANGSGLLGTPGPINTVVVSTSGTYSVSVASASGCVSTTSTVVTADQTVPSISISSSSTTLSCASPTVSLSAIGSGSVRWSTGETTAVISVSAAGPYSVTAMGDNGCTAVASVSVSQDNTVPVASLISSGSLSCSVTSVTLTASPGGQSYTFSSGATQIGATNQAVVSASGAYSVTVLLGNGCSATASTSVSQDNTVPTASLTNNGPLSCSTTSVTLTASGGDGYQFSAGADQIGNGPTATVSTAGIYSVTVVSTNGCSSVASTTVTGDQTVPTASLTSNGPLSCSITSVTLTASGGGTYLFSSGASQIGNGNTATVSSAGSYSVTVLSGNGCSAVASVSVSQDNTAPVASLFSSGTLSCALTSVTLTASPGGLNYLFSAGSTQISTSNQAVVSMAGTYSVTVLSGNGCSATASTTVQSNTAAVSVTNPTVSTATVGVAFSQPFTALGGTSPYNYNLASGSLPSGLSLSNTGVLSGTPTQTGSFTITVRGQDATGCSGVSASYVLTVTDAASLNPTLAGFSASSGAVCAGSSVAFTATVGNVTGSYNYTLTNGLTAPLTGSASGSLFSQSITASGTAPQSFTLTVRANGQSAASVTTLTVNPLPVASLVSSGTLSCALTSVTLTAGGGSSYTFASGSGVVGTSGPINTMVVSTGGTYSVTVADASGCVSTTSTVVTADQNGPSISINPGSATLTCASPTVSLTAVGAGNALWSTGSTDRMITVTTTGTYSVTLTSANGCSASASVVIDGDQSAPTASLVSSGSLTCAVAGVTLTANASGGSGYTYAFSSGASQLGTTNQATVTQAGSYSVTVTSPTGCSVVAAVTVSASTSVATPNFATRGNQAIADGLTSVTVVQNTASVMFNATNCSGTLNWSGNGQTGTTTLNAPTSTAGVFVYQATCTVGSCVSSPASVTVTITPANTAPAPTANANQTATVDQPFTYTANAFTDAETPNSLVYTASFNPANSLMFNPATRVIQGTPMNTGVTSVTLTATDPGGLKASTTFTITVLPVSVVTNLTVLSRDPENGNLNTNTIKPYLLLQNDGTEAIPYGELTVRYYLTVENAVPLRFDINYAQMGNDKIHLNYVPLSPARQGAGGYIEFSFDASAGSLAPMSNAVIQDLVNKQDYSSFFQGDDYSYVNNPNFAANPRITAYRNGVLVYGVEPLPTGPPAPLGATLTANPMMLPTTGNTTLTVGASGGTGSYSYAFSGPGTIVPNGNTARVSNLPAGVQTFTVVVTDNTAPVAQRISATVSVTVTAPANQPPVASANANQTATVGLPFTYTVGAFTDDTPGSLTYTASINPANGLTFNPAVRVIQGTPVTTGVSSVTITVIDPGGLSASTVFTITVNAVPVAPTALTLTAAASPATLPATGTTTLTASVVGGTPGYTFTFSGPGTIAPTVNTAQVSNLPAGVQTFTITARDATSPVNQTIATTVSVTVTVPANQAPVATTNANQTATVGQAFIYTVNAFTDDTPGSLTYTVSIDPANGLSFDAATRIISGTPINTGSSSVTVTATDPGGLSASTVFIINVLTAPVVTDRLTVYSRDPDNGQLNTNTLKPYLQLQNEGSTPIPYGELTVRYWLTVENPAPFRFEINYAQLGSDKVHLTYVPISPVRQGASGYIEFRFDASAGSLAASSNSGPIQDLINKQDYSYFNQGDDYSYVNNSNFAANPRITAYRNGTLIYGTEPPVGTRVAADGADALWTVQVLGNPVEGVLVVEITGAEGEPLHLSLVDESGHVVSRRPVVPTTGRHQEVFDVSGQGAGLLLLQAESATHQQTLKVLKR